MATTTQKSQETGPNTARGKKAFEYKDHLDLVDGEVREIYLLMNQQSIEAELRIRSLELEVQLQAKRLEGIKEKIQSEMAESEAKVAEANALEKQCFDQFSKVLPELQEATVALQTLDKQDFIEMKSFVNPPVLIKKTMEACFLMLGRAYDTEDKVWQEAKKEFSDPIKFVGKLQNFDKDNIPDKTHQNLTKFFSKVDFEPEKIARASKAAKGLCRWVKAMHNYHIIHIQAKPFQQALVKAKETVSQLQEKLDADRAALNEVLLKTEELTKGRETVELEREEIKKKMLDYEETLDLAIEVQNLMKE